MKFDDFFQLLYDNWGMYVLSMLIVLPFFIYIFRKLFVSLIDPLTMVLVMSFFANVIPVFLFLMQKIPTFHFVYFCIAETIFWIGFLLAKRFKLSVSNRKLTNEKELGFIIYLLSFFLLTSFTLITYSKLGIPAFMKSRLEVYYDSGGLGALGRLNPFFATYCILYSFYLLFNKSANKKILKTLAVFVFFVIIVFSILSGSRSSVLSLAFGYFGYLYFCEKEMPNKKIMKRLIVLGMAGALVIFSFSSKNGLIGSFNSLVTRIVACGDGYWMAYPKDKIGEVDVSPWGDYFFSGILGPLRMVDYSEVKPAIGAQLSWALTPSKQGIMLGPNARPPILGYVMFGKWGLLFSFLVGFFCSFMAFKLTKVLPQGIVTSIFCYYAYFNMLTFVGDPSVGVNSLFDTMLNAIVLLCLLTFIVGIVKIVGFSSTSN